jgi:3-methyladenine DNA glycosylase AlkD
MTKIVNDIRKELILNSDEKTKQSGERFFKEDVKIYGLKSATTRKIGKNHYRSLTDKSKLHIFSLCEELWKSGFMEESFIACNWSHNVCKYFQKTDFKIFEFWINTYITNWATCDTFCNHTVGTFIEMYPELLSGLKIWATSDNRWVKRAAAVSLIVPAKKGMFLDDIFEIAEILDSDQDDMVQKGYGWMLKVASQKHHKQVFDYVMKKKSSMPRTAFRYAIEKMPADLRHKAMDKS